MKSKFLVGLFSILLITTSCGYTREVQLPGDIKTIYVSTVKNEVPLAEVYAYQPGVEMDITQAVIDRFQSDGNLKVVAKEEADAILDMTLIKYEQDGVRFTSLERVEEYRLFIVIEMQLIDAKTEEVLFEEKDFSGDAEYFVGEIRSQAREEGTHRAINRLARNVVDRIVEDW